MAAAVQFLFGQFVPVCRHWIDKRFDYCVLQMSDGGAVDLRIGEDRFELHGRWFWSSYPGPRITFHAAEESPAEARPPRLGRAAARTASVSKSNSARPRSPAWVHRYLAFAGPAVQQWMREGLFPVPPQPVPAHRDYAGTFDQLLELSRRSDRLGLARAALLLESILTELAEARQKSAEPSAPWLAETLARLQGLQRLPTQEELAAEAGMPPRTFRRKFTQAVGVSPHEYAIACRLGHARQMLGHTELPIKAIAEQLGYQDVSFFTRQFRNVVGVPPAAYRRSREG